MYKFLSDKNNLIALSLLGFLLVFLSCPFLVKADASVNGFFPKDFVNQGLFKEGAFDIALKEKLPKPQPARLDSNSDQSDDNCREIINTSADTFAIPLTWSKCNPHKYNR